LHAAANAFSQERAAFNHRNKSTNLCTIWSIGAMLLNSFGGC